MPEIDWGWVVAHLGAIADRTGQHLYLTAIALVAGFVISFALAVWSIRRRAVYPLVATFATVVYTIPSLALFVALVPITGISSILTPEIPLVLYTLVIFVPNIVAGFDAVPLDVLEAADGMGFGRWQRWRRVEVPLAIPLVVAGLRVASVSTIGLVTITSTIGIKFGGLGYFIYDGYNRQFATEMLTGAVPSIVLAVAADVCFVLLQRAITPWTRAAGPASR